MQSGSKTALCILDIQPNIIAGVADKDNFVEQVNSTVEFARKKGLLILFSVVGFRPGFPEIGERNKMFSSIKAHGSPSMIEPSPVIAPRSGEIVITKRRISAFTGSDLEVVLRGQGISNLVLCGVATSLVVLSTAYEAADKDYGLTVLSDLCRDSDEEVHRVLTEKVLPKQANVMTAAEWRNTLS